MSSYRFALRPKWILSHLFVLALVATMVVAGFWQLSRLQEKKDRNARVVARTAEPVAEASTLADPGEFDKAGALEFRRVSATGHYLVDQEVLVRSRSRDESPGSWVLTPLALGDGTAVVVNRGWIPNPGDIHSVPSWSKAPTGEVEVEGLVRETETRGRFGSTDPATGTLTDLARADVARLDQQVPERVLPFYLQLQTQDPAVARTDPKPVPTPELDEGPHFSYAVQWFIFTTIAVIGYPLILRRRAREDPDAIAPEPDDRDESDDSDDVLVT